MQAIKDAVIKLIDATLPKQGIVDKQGGLVTFDYYDLNPDLMEYMKYIGDELFASSPLMSHIGEKGFGGKIDFTDFFYVYPDAIKLIDDRVVSAIKDYLGTGAKLDFAALAIFNMNGREEELINYSGMYHHDSVGRRLKFFFPLNLDGNRQYPTSYLLGTHRLVWETYANPLDSDGVRIPGELVKKYQSVGSDEKIVTFGTAYLFDTNAIHAGCYRPSKQPRLVVQFEFSNRKSLFVRGQVGPSQFTMHKAVYEYLKRLELVREHNVKALNDNRYLHVGRPNRRTTVDIGPMLASVNGG